MYVCNSEIVQKANRIVAQCSTRDPKRIARELGIEVMYLPFSKQRGAYKVIMRNRFMFIKDNLHPVMENIVLLHELGHDALHREEATKVGGFKEFEIFNMRDNRMEYEANLFAAQISLVVILECPRRRATLAMETPVNNSKEACVCRNPWTEMTGMLQALQCLPRMSFTVEL